MTAPTLSNAASASGRISAFPKSNSTSACKLMLIACGVSWYLSASLSFSSSACFFWRSSSVCLTSFFLIFSSFSICVGVVAACCPRAAPTTKKNRAAATAMAQGARAQLHWSASVHTISELAPGGDWFVSQNKICRSCFKVNIGHDSSTTDRTGAPILYRWCCPASFRSIQ